MLTQIAMTVPTTQDALAKTRAIPNNIANNAEVLALLNAAKNAKNDVVPKKTIGPNLSAAQEDQFELLKMALKIIARQHNVSTRLIANNDELTQFILTPDTSSLLKGWRFEIFGSIAKDLLHGVVGMKIKDGKLVLEA